MTMRNRFSLAIDLDLLEQETRLALGRLAQPGSNPREAVSPSLPKLDALTRSIASKAATLQQHYLQTHDQRRLGTATSLKASADQMTQMVTALATVPRSYISGDDEAWMLNVLTNILQMKHDALSGYVQNLRG